jgi:CRP-like cAMP-binding protein
MFYEGIAMAASPNRLLDFLSSEDFEWVKPHLKPVKLSQGMVLADEGGTFQHAYFPHTAVVSLVRSLNDGRVAEMATFGREALVGLSLGNNPLQTFGRYIVQIPGEASRINSDRLQEAAVARPGIQHMLDRYAEVLMMLTLQYVACNAAHSIEARCSRWLVATHDRVKKDELRLTHQSLASTLGVQRSTVSETLQSLQRRGLIRQGRGSITVMNRIGLQGAACECYSLLRERYLKLLPNVPR